MTDPNRKELSTDTLENISQPAFVGEPSVDVDYDKATIFIGGDAQMSMEWVVAPQTNEGEKATKNPWEFIDGRLYRFEDYTNPEIAKSQGEDVHPGLYVKVKPVDVEDFDNPALIDNIKHAINIVLLKWAGIDEEYTKYNLIPARYLKDERLFLVRVEPQIQ